MDERRWRNAIFTEVEWPRGQHSRHTYALMSPGIEIGRASLNRRPFRSREEARRAGFAFIEG